jgi:hypothetical protein
VLALNMNDSESRPLPRAMSADAGPDVGVELCEVEATLNAAQRIVSDGASITRGDQRAP